MVYKVLIVDDEYMILEGMKQLLDYSKLRVEIVHTAESAEDALEYVKTNPVDLIITDVSMSGMSGLEMIQEMEKLRYDFSYIVMSGYKEFDYVKQSMSLGVVDYLVKPINKQELFDAISQIVYKKLRKSSVALDFLKGKTVAMDALFDNIATQDELLYLVASEQVLPSIISLERHVLGRGIYVSIVDTLLSKETYLCSEPLTKASQLDVFLAQVEKQLFYGKCEVSTDKSMWDIYQQLYPLVASGKVNLFLQELGQLQEVIEAMTPNVHLIKQVFIQLMMDVYQYFNRVDHDELQTLFLRVKNCQTELELLQFVSDELFNMVELHHYSHNVKEVLDIIAKEYQTELTLKAVSQRLFINTVYLGQLIKKETTLTFAELLNKQRVKVAQQLLLGSENSIEEICYQVGYSNVGYFYKIFKRLCGESPKAYRKQILELKTEWIVR